jgi:hypothetical protein
MDESKELRERIKMLEAVLIAARHEIKTGYRIAGLDPDKGPILKDIDKALKKQS